MEYHSFGDVTDDVPVFVLSGYLIYDLGFKKFSVSPDGVHLGLWSLINTIMSVTFGGMWRRRE